MERCQSKMWELGVAEQRTIASSATPGDVVLETRGLDSGG